LESTFPLRFTPLYPNQHFCVASLELVARHSGISKPSRDTYDTALNLSQTTHITNQTSHSVLACSSSRQTSKTVNLITTQAKVHFKNEQSGLDPFGVL